MTAARSLYLPLEGLARELDGKLLLALVARERGWRTLIGLRSSIFNRSSILPPGIVLAHNARGAKPTTFEQLRGFGHQSVVLDEEGLVRQTDEIFTMKHQKDAFRDVELVLTWGEDDAALWRKSGQVEPQRVAVTGNPRMDVLRPDLRSFHQPEINAIRERHGDYVLMNTNFATINHFIPRRSTLVLADGATDAQVEEQRTGLLGHKQALFERFLELVPKIAAAIAPLRLVVRPHPSESNQPWIDAIANSSNASVIFEGSVVPWIAGARAVIHNGCTSAVESAVLGTTVLTYRPVQSDIYDNPLPNGVGTECFDDDALLSALRDVVSDGPRPLTPAQSELLGHHVANTSGRLSCDHIIDAFEQLPAAGEGMAAAGMVAWCRRYLAVQWRAKSRRIGNPFKKRNKTREAYSDRIFPETTPEYLNDRIVRFQQALNRFEGCRARRLSANLFAIE
jgi:surface carbohydrate biosynthesis protein